MSASKQKKLRQELASQGYVDPKAEREAEEKAKNRKSNILYAAVAVLFVVVGAIVLIWNSGKLQSSATALTIGDTKYNAAEVSYYYRNAYSSIASSGYASYYGLDTAADLSKQNLNDTAKMLLGVDEDMTWKEYFVSTAKQDMITYTAIEKAALAAGHSRSEDAVVSEVNATMASLEQYAKQNGYSVKDYLSLLYGSVMTVDTFKDMVAQQALVSLYASEYQNSLSYTEADMEAYYESDKECFDVADYNYIYFSGLVEKEDGTEATEEENAAQLLKAEEDANAALAMLNEGKTMEEVAAQYPDASYLPVNGGENYGDALSNWVFSSDRTAGDVAVIDNDGSGYYVAQFGSIGRQEYNTVDVRHILITPDTASLDSTSETYEADLAAANDAAKAQAEDILNQWKSGDATEESFAELAKEYTADSNAAQGGLYEQVYKGQMVASFNDWCFDESRKAGDTDIVETTYGYHVMYFVGQNVPYWQLQAESEMKSGAMNDWLGGLTEGLEAAEGKGMKYVG